MKIEPADIYGWSGQRISHGDIVLGLVPQLGGRIMSLTLAAEELLYVPDDGRGVLPELPADGEDLTAFKKRAGFRLFGGDKTWVAPEYEWIGRCPPVDLDAGAYAFEIRDGAAVMTSPVCRETSLQVIRRVALRQNGGIALTETLINRGQGPVTRGVWNVTQVRRPFDVLLPVTDGGLRSYHLEDPSLPDTGIEPLIVKGWATVPCREALCFKFGAMLREGRAAALIDTPSGRIMFARVFDIDASRPYAHRSMAEVYNSHRFGYGEVEVHAPLVTLAPGAATTLSQLWRVGRA